MKRGLAALIVLASLFPVGCKKAPDSSTSSPGPTSSAPDPAKGKQVYLANCISCHSADPSKVGSNGPAVAGASHALLEARILRAEYPPGYKPLRGTRIMQPMPYLKPRLDDLTAFLTIVPTERVTPTTPRF